MMKNNLCILLTGLLLGWSTLTLANGKLTHLSGSVSVQKADGSKVTAVPGSEVGQGETVHTGKDGFARMETTDGGEIVLRPNSEFVVEKYHYDTAKPEEDSFVYNMVKGGLRTVTGLIGKRGNKDAYQGKTPTSTIGIRGTLYEVRVCAGDCGPNMPNGTYFSVISGSIQTGNSAGSVTMTQGQFVFVPPGGKPQILTTAPDIGFTPPSKIPELKEKLNNGANSNSNGPEGVSCVIQ